MIPSMESIAGGLGSLMGGGTEMNQNNTQSSNISSLVNLVIGDENDNKSEPNLTPTVSPIFTNRKDYTTSGGAVGKSGDYVQKSVLNPTQSQPFSIDKNISLGALIIGGVFAIAYMIKSLRG